jgi:N-acetyl-anhydromuramyl-L-alanine amidase AmpD
MSITIYVKFTLDHIIGHQDAAQNRTCPGKKFDLEKLRNIVKIAAEI